MGVTGLWRLIEPAGKPVPVETLENKVLAVDISIWLHQVVKGYQDAKGAPLPNAHLIGLFQRVCKLLYFRIKPVFVFDGAFPELKKETIGKRQENKLKFNSESERIKRELVLLLSKKTAISSLLGKQIPTKKPTQENDDLFKLPALPQKEDSESESEDEQDSSGSVIDLHSVDVESDKFKNLPVKEKYDLLIELKDTRKMNSWGKIHELPKKSDNFSDFQMQRLLKRRKVEECLQETEKEMGDSGMSLRDLECLLNEEGIDTKIESIPTRRIAANDTTRFVLINDVKQALADAKKKKEAETQACTSRIDEVQDKPNSEEAKSKKDELEEDIERAIKISLECVNDANTSVCSKTDDSWTTNVTDTDYSSYSEDDDGSEVPDMSSAKAYIMQYSDFTDEAIHKIVSKSNKNNKIKSNKPKLNEILDEINKEKSVIIDKIDLSSSDDDCIEEIKDLENKTVATHGVAETNSPSDLELQDEHVDTTQASVVCLGNIVEDIVTLDSSAEESSSQANNLIETKESSSELKNKDESDSSDNDFEDVPEVEEIKNKTVVQLTLNVNDEPDDDIFADVFVTKTEQNNDSSILREKSAVTIVSPKLIQLADEDDELQKAIKMSLECVAEENLAENKDASINEQGPSTKAKPVNIVEESTITKSLKPSKTQESLNAIQSAQSSKQNEVTKAKDITVEREAGIMAEKTYIRPQEPISRERLNEMVEDIQNEEQDLEQEKGRLDRVGRNITQQMTREAQELLRLLGIPYIVAPMEAEAQCAFLESVKLTDGTITDDSDIWLFGGRTVYKNFFNQKKHVLQFLAEKIEKSFNLSREQLVLLALLVGSDYTTGLAGVGPVTALEILASFPFNKRKLLAETAKQSRYAEMVTGLQEFKKWAKSGKRTDNTSLKKKLRNIEVTDDFPSVRVVQAYLEPNIESSEDKFSWGEIDITILRDYTKAKFGWSQNKLDEIIKPVLKRVLERKTQKTVHDYFKRKVNIDSLEDQMSKRVKAAVQKMGPETNATEESAVSETKALKPAGKRKVGKGDSAKAGPSKSKQKKTDEDILKSHIVKVVSEAKESQSGIEIVIPKTDRFQEIIPQREKDKQGLLQNKMKAIELFRKTQMDKKKKIVKRKPLVPKPEAELSESSDSN